MFNSQAWLGRPITGGKADAQRLGSLARVGKSRLRRESHPRIMTPLHDDALSAGVLFQ